MSQPPQTFPTSTASAAATPWCSQMIRRRPAAVWLSALALAAALAPLAGCLGGQETAAAEDFATSGSDEADQRAEQVMNREAQLEGGETDKETQPKTLFTRLGGEAGLQAIVDDAVDRAIADPRVNATRAGLDGGWFGSAPKAWKASPQNVATLKQHLADFLELAAGGPVTYDGPELTAAFAGRQFSNVEFDAAVGSLQATMDKLGIPDQEQKEVLAIIETTREQVVEVR